MTIDERVEQIVASWGGPEAITSNEAACIVVADILYPIDPETSAP